MIKLDDNWSGFESADDAIAIPWYSYRTSLICNHCGVAVGVMFIRIHEAWHEKLGQ